MILYEFLRREFDRKKEQRRGPTPGVFRRLLGILIEIERLGATFAGLRLLEITDGPDAGGVILTVEECPYGAPALFITSGRPPALRQWNHGVTEETPHAAPADLKLLAMAFMQRVSDHAART